MWSWLLMSMLTVQPSPTGFALKCATAPEAKELFAKINEYKVSLF